MAGGGDVEVKFGASVQGLVGGITKIQEQIESVRAPIELLAASRAGSAAI